VQEDSECKLQKLLKETNQAEIKKVEKRRMGENGHSKTKVTNNTKERGLKLYIHIRIVSINKDIH